VGGAAGIGSNQGLACGQAVSRAVGAIAITFADKNDDIAEDVAKSVGVSDGRIFLQRYAKETAMEAAVQDVQFDPIEHLCVASIRWTPPVFVKEAMLKYAEAVKRQELGSPPAVRTAESATAPASTPPPTAAPAPAAATPAPTVVSTPAPVPAPAPICEAERAHHRKTLKAKEKAVADFNECKRRTSGDEGICSRYKAYNDEATDKETVALQRLNDCVSAGR